jgi:hypothetical protein
MCIQPGWRQGFVFGNGHTWNQLKDGWRFDAPACSFCCPVCSPYDLGTALLDVLLSCRSSLAVLQLDIQGAPLLVCSLLPRLAAKVGGPPCVPLPALRALTLRLEGSPACSQATNALHAEHALQASRCS